MSTNQDLYFFGGGRAEGDGKMRDVLGGKGAGLAEMTNAGVPVPPGFTIATPACIEFMKNGGTVPERVVKAQTTYLERLETLMEKRLGDPQDPLLVSVRSGAKFSMPGMMDTILNLGLNDDTVVALALATKNERFAWDCYRRFIQMYGDVVMGVQKSPSEDHEPFEVVIHELKHERYHADVDDPKLTVD
ncbi:MAG TPA: PEP/pyruvate-binding domain-containing protein, partial [Dongiaceae bacterium]|nr:PEP/pyruvate-binding domain-containing protein [Dongiaceae bacterium]